MIKREGRACEWVWIRQGPAGQGMHREQESSPREWPGHAVASVMWRYLLSTLALVRDFIINVCSIVLNAFSASLVMIV